MALLLEKKIPKLCCSALPWLLPFYTTNTCTIDHCPRKSPNIPQCCKSPTVMKSGDESMMTFLGEIVLLSHSNANKHCG